MNIQNASITVSAVKPAQYPKEGYPEIAFAGRSNVGKSSFINKMLARKKLARTSSTPGKTAQINFYNIDECIYFVDLPGYGYAAVSKEEKRRWGEMMQTYLDSRKTLRQTALLVDTRHKPTGDDLQMMNWIRHRHGRALVFATKIDKVGKSKRTDHLDLIYYTLGLTDDDIMIPVSSETGEGREDAWEAIAYVLGIEPPKIPV